MKKELAISVALLAVPQLAIAGGIDRSGQSVAALFEDGRYLELSFGYVSPDVSGTGNAILGGGSSGDMAGNFARFGAAYKADINDRLSYALILDEPFGADVDYPVGTGYFAQGALAEFNSYALTGLLRYKTPTNFSVYGGVRLQSVEASATVPFVAGYNVEGEQDYGVGFVVGASYEIPDIKLRVDLTYNSEISHSLRTTETSASPLGGPNVSETEFDTPESINLNFQTGIAPGTLLFGGVRWVDWNDFAITPANYQVLTGGGSLVSYADDRTTWTLGLGRALNEQWSVAGSVSYERSTGSVLTNLGPTDGFTQFNLAAIYTLDNMKITTGITYRDIGDAITAAALPDGTPVVPAGTFNGNDFIGVGIKVGWSF